VQFVCQELLALSGKPLDRRSINPKLSNSFIPLFSLKQQQMTDSLKQIFTEHGKIVSVFVKIDILRKSPYGFVCFENNEDAKKAMQAYG
jgi:RNA recognition motif. (a.k.a. RRM, RBD, or RNP domain)